MKTKSLGMRLKTLRSGIRCTPATLHLEITMLLHQQRRLHSELETLNERSAVLNSLLETTEQRIGELRIQSDALDPEGWATTKRRSALTENAQHSGDSVLREQEEDRGKQSGEGFRHMSLSY